MNPINSFLSAQQATENIKLTRQQANQAAQLFEIEKQDAQTQADFNKMRLDQMQQQIDMQRDQYIAGELRSSLYNLKKTGNIAGFQRLLQNNEDFRQQAAKMGIQNINVAANFMNDETLDSLRQQAAILDGRPGDAEYASKIDKNRFVLITDGNGDLKWQDINIWEAFVPGYREYEEARNMEAESHMSKMNLDNSSASKNYADASEKGQKAAKGEYENTIRELYSKGILNERQMRDAIAAMNGTYPPTNSEATKFVIDQQKTNQLRTNLGETTNAAIAITNSKNLGDSEEQQKQEAVNATYRQISKESKVDTQKLRNMDSLSAEELGKVYNATQTTAGQQNLETMDSMFRQNAPDLYKRYTAIKGVIDAANDVYKVAPQQVGLWDNLVKPIYSFFNSEPEGQNVAALNNFINASIVMSGVLKDGYLHKDVGKKLFSMVPATNKGYPDLVNSIESNLQTAKTKLKEFSTSREGRVLAMPLTLQLKAQEKLLGGLKQLYKLDSDYSSKVKRVVIRPETGDAIFIIPKEGPDATNYKDAKEEDLINSDMAYIYDQHRNVLVNSKGEILK